MEFNRDIILSGAKALIETEGSKADDEELKKIYYSFRGIMAEDVSEERWGDFLLTTLVALSWFLENSKKVVDTGAAS